MKNKRTNKTKSGKIDLFQKIAEHSNLAREARDEGDNREAIAQWETSIELFKLATIECKTTHKVNPKIFLSACYTFKAENLIGLKHVEAAYKDIQTAVTLWPQNPLANFYVAFDCLHRGELDKAWKHGQYFEDEGAKNQLKDFLYDTELSDISYNVYPVLAHISLARGDEKSYLKFSKLGDQSTLAIYLSQTDHHERAKKIAIILLGKHKRENCLEDKDVANLKYIWGQSLVLGIFPRQAITTSFSKKIAVNLRLITQNIALDFSAAPAESIDENLYKKTLSETEVSTLKIALGLLEQAETLGCKKVYPYLYQIYKLDEFKDAEKELQSLKKWAETRSFTGITMLCVHYCNLEEKEFKLKLPFLTRQVEVLENWYNNSANKYNQLFQEKSDFHNLTIILERIANYYSQADNIDNNIDLTLQYFKRASQYSVASKQRMAFFCLTQGFLGIQRAMSLGIKTFKELAKQGIDNANYILGMVYYVFQDYNRSQHYLRVGYSNGIAGCDKLLCLIYSKQLMAFDKKHPQYILLASELEKFKESANNSQFNEKLDQIQLEGGLQKVVELAQQNQTFELPGEPSVRLKRILESEFPFSTSISISSFIYNIGHLVASCRHDNPELPSLLTKITSFLQILPDALNTDYFSTLSICQTIAGISRLYCRGFNPLWGQLIKTLCQNLLNNKYELTLFELASLLSSFIRTPLETDFIASELGSLISQFLANLERNIASQQNISGIFYHLAILNNYVREKPRIKMRKLRLKEVKPLVDYAILQLENDNAGLVEKHQYFLGSLYFIHHYKLNVDITPLKIFQKKYQKEKLDVTVSNLQAKIYTYLKAFLPSLESEYPINTLPVDIFWPEENIVIQINGPNRHFQYLNDQPDGYVFSPKHCFHDAILNSTLEEQQKPLRILHINFHCYEQKGDAYIHEVFQAEKINLDYRQRTNAKEKELVISRQIGRFGMNNVTQERQGQANSSRGSTQLYKYGY
jgi:hypothetical protein